MLKILTAQNAEFPISWIGVSDFDGSLRFEVLSDDLNMLFGVFSDPGHTQTLTRVFDENKKTFEGFTALKGIERMGTGNTVVRLMKGDNT